MSAEHMRRADLAARLEKYNVDRAARDPYEVRRPEYTMVARELRQRGLEDGQTILDVGAGDFSMGRLLRVEDGWQGMYIPLEGSIDGTDLETWTAPKFFPDWIVCIEVLEHLYDPARLIREMLEMQPQALIVTTPNAEVVDVLSTDPTHVTPITADHLRSWGVPTVEFLDFSRKSLSPENRDYRDTLMGIVEASGEGRFH